MRLNELPPVPGSVHKKKRVGRGNASGHGTYAGRGIKGQKSRSGPDLRIGFEGGQIPLVRALSRRRGFTNRFRVEYEPVNLASLARFDASSNVDVAALKAAGLVRTSKPVKVLGEGEISVKLTVEAHRFSAAARSKIEAAGGSVVELTPRPVKDEASAAAPAAEVLAEPAAEAPVRPPRTRAPRARRPAAETASTEGPAPEPPASESEETGETKD